MLRTPATIMSLGLMGLGLTLTPIAPAQAGPAVTLTETGTFSALIHRKRIVVGDEFCTANSAMMIPKTRAAVQ